MGTNASRIQIKRAYEAAAADDGARYLVDHIWPRGVKKEVLHIDGWDKAVAPSGDLRIWFAHDPAKWEEFRRRYFVELDANPAGWQPLAESARKGVVTLVYAARDTEHNNARAIKEYLERKLQAG